MVMNIRQCKRCGKLFNSVSSPFCSDCLDEVDQAYLVVRDYIYDHPDSAIIEITAKTGVSEKMILQFLKESRLSIAESSGLLVCENCGKPLSQGRYCQVCMGAIDKELERVTPGTPVRKREPLNGSASKERMHIRYKR